MPLLTTADFKKGVRIELDGDPFVILDTQNQTPSARGTQLIVKVRVRNLRTGQVLDKSFRGGDKVEAPDFALRAIQFLYKAESPEDDEALGEYHFMDSESFEQFSLTGGQLGEQRLYLSEGLSGLRSMLHNDQVIAIELPHTVELEVAETEPTLKGATATATTKPATLTTGLVLQVPGYIEAGDVRQGRHPRYAVHRTHAPHSLRPPLGTKIGRPRLVRHLPAYLLALNPHVPEYAPVQSCGGARQLPHHPRPLYGVERPGLGTGNRTVGPGLVPGPGIEAIFVAGGPRLPGSGSYVLGPRPHVADYAPARPCGRARQSNTYGLSNRPPHNFFFCRDKMNC